MSTKTQAIPRISARDRLLAAATELFYAEGVNSVGIDRVIERAGVAKASLYAHFDSKDDLVRAYLEQRQESRKTRIVDKLATLTAAKDKMLAVFEVLSEGIAQPGYRGCPFVRASSESRSGSGVRDACNRYRQWIRALLVEQASAAGAPNPAELADHLLLVYDGASVSAQMDDKSAAAHLARSLSKRLIESACAAHAAG